VEQIEKLSKLSRAELEAMHLEMKEVLDYNFNHFYSTFKELVVDEMLDNFKSCINQWNNGRIGDKRIDLSMIDFVNVRKTLLS
jgi:hypothetical protein